MGVTKKMLDKDFEQIALILEEASRFGLRREVEHFAQTQIKENPDMDPVQAYENAYNVECTLIPGRTALFELFK